jgi:hypothetical protein
MMNAHYLRKLASENFLLLKLHKAPSDERDDATLRREAARAAVREVRLSHAHTHAQPNAHNALDLLVSKLWTIARNMAATRELTRKKSTPAPPPVEPSIAAAPLVIDEPPQSSNIVAFPQHAPLVPTTFSNAQVIPNEMYPARYIDRTTENWKSSIRANEELAKYREQQSAAHRQRTRYIGS